MNSLTHRKKIAKSLKKKTSSKRHIFIRTKSKTVHQKGGRKRSQKGGCGCGGIMA